MFHLFVSLNSLSATHRWTAGWTDFSCADRWNHQKESKLTWMSLHKTFTRHVATNPLTFTKEEKMLATGEGSFQTFKKKKAPKVWSSHSLSIKKKLHVCDLITFCSNVTQELTDAEQFLWWKKDCPIWFGRCNIHLFNLITHVHYFYMAG